MRIAKNKSYKTDGNNTIKRFSLTTQKLFNNRRLVLHGFPYDGKFKDIEEVNQYLSGDRIQCLLCGKSYKLLATHIMTIHGVTVDQYKEKYGIPWEYGLSSSGTRKKMAINAKEGIKSGRLMCGVDEMSDAQINKQRLAMKKRRKLCPAIVKMSTNRMQAGYKSHCVELKKARDSVRDEMIKYRETGFLLEEISLMFNMGMTKVSRMLNGW